MENTVNHNAKNQNTAKKKGKTIHVGVFVKRILFCLLFVYFSCQLISQQFKFAKLKEENIAVDAKIEAAQKEQKNLHSELESIDSEDYLRRIIREKLGYTKPNEKVFVDDTK